MQSALRKLEVKFEVLNLVVKGIPRAINKTKLGDLIVTNNRGKKEDCREFKLKVQEVKLESEEDPSDVFEQGNEFENKLEKVLEAVTELNDSIKQIKTQDTRESEIQEEQLQEKKNEKGDWKRNVNLEN